MTTSKVKSELFVWIFLPGKSEPVVAGRLYESNTHKNVYNFNYGQSYLEREDAVAIFNKELPLRAGEIKTAIDSGMECPSAIRDAAPDAWGRRVIIHSIYGRLGGDIETVTLSEIEYLLRSGSDRVGAIDFQESPTEYVPREHKQSTLDELINSADLIQKGVKLSPELVEAIQYGTPIGGARPKTLITEGDKKFIAKFSTSMDVFSVVKGEYIAMKLASLTGMNIANVMLKQASGRDVLLVERFDREYIDGSFFRKRFVSALTLLGLGEMQAPYASYEELAEIIRVTFQDPREQLEELFKRITFNIICGNTDDHARNHGTIIQNDNSMILSPAYDICPQNRVGQEASQGMRLSRSGQNLSQLSLCLKFANIFGLTTTEARNIIVEQINVIGEHWTDICDEAEFTDVDRNLFRGNQFLNPFSYEDIDGENSIIKEAAREALVDMREASGSRLSYR